MTAAEIMLAIDARLNAKVEDHIFPIPIPSYAVFFPILVTEAKELIHRGMKPEPSLLTELCEATGMWADEIQLARDVLNIAQRAYKAFALAVQLRRESATHIADGEDVEALKEMIDARFASM